MQVRVSVSRRTEAFIGDRQKCRAVDVAVGEQRIVCRESFRAKVMLLLISFVFGPGLGGMIWWAHFYRPRIITTAPWMAKIMVPIWVVVCTLLLVRTIRWQRVIVLDFAKKVAVFAGRSFRKFVDTRDLSQVTGVRVGSVVRLKDSHHPASKANQVTCYLLTLDFAEGPVILFETTDEALTANVAGEISQRLGVPLDGGVPPTETSRA